MASSCLLPGTQWQASCQPYQEQSQWTQVSEHNAFSSLFDEFSGDADGLAVSAPLAPFQLTVLSVPSLTGFQPHSLGLEGLEAGQDYDLLPNLWNDPAVLLNGTTSLPTELANLSSLDFLPTYTTQVTTFGPVTTHGPAIQPSTALPDHRLSTSDSHDSQNSCSMGGGSDTNNNSSSSSGFGASSSSDGSIQHSLHATPGVPFGSPQRLASGAVSHSLQSFHPASLTMDITIPPVQSVPNDQPFLNAYLDGPLAGAGPLSLKATHGSQPAAPLAGQSIVSSAPSQASQLTKAKPKRPPPRPTSTAAAATTAVAAAVTAAATAVTAAVKALKEATAAASAADVAAGKAGSGKRRADRRRPQHAIAELEAELVAKQAEVAALMQRRGRLARKSSLLQEALQWQELSFTQLRQPAELRAPIQFKQCIAYDHDPFKDVLLSMSVPTLHDHFQGLRSNVSLTMNAVEASGGGIRELDGMVQAMNQMGNTLRTLAKYKPLLLRQAAYTDPYSGQEVPVALERWFPAVRAVEMTTEQFEDVDIALSMYEECMEVHLTERRALMQRLAQLLAAAVNAISASSCSVPPPTAVAPAQQTMDYMLNMLGTSNTTVSGRPLIVGGQPVTASGGTAWNGQNALPAELLAALSDPSLVPVLQANGLGVLKRHSSGRVSSSNSNSSGSFDVSASNPVHNGGGGDGSGSQYGAGSGPESDSGSGRGSKSEHTKVQTEASLLLSASTQLGFPAVPQQQFQKQQQQQQQQVQDSGISGGARLHLQTLHAVEAHSAALEEVLQQLAANRRAEWNAEDKLASIAFASWQMPQMARLILSCAPSVPPLVDLLRAAALLGSRS